MKKLFKKLYQYFNNHRYIFGMYPKNWNEEKEKEYQKWAEKYANIKSFYNF